jgi:hypothetical protein
MSERSLLRPWNSVVSGVYRSYGRFFYVSRNPSTKMSKSAFIGLVGFMDLALSRALERAVFLLLLRRSGECLANFS